MIAMNMQGLRISVDHNKLDYTIIINKLIITIVTAVIISLTLIIATLITRKHYE